MPSVLLHVSCVHLYTISCCFVRPFDRSVAMQNLRETENVTITTAETLLFELTRTSEHPHFRTLSNLMKEHKHLSFQERVPTSSETDNFVKA
jgi:hypothetical protein